MATVLESKFKNTGFPGKILQVLPGIQKGLDESRGAFANEVRRKIIPRSETTIGGSNRIILDQNIDLAQSSSNGALNQSRARRFAFWTDRFIFEDLTEAILRMLRVVILVYKPPSIVIGDNLDNVEFIGEAWTEYIWEKLSGNRYMLHTTISNIENSDIDTARYDLSVYYFNTNIKGTV